jgi:hypothetical protein
MELKVVQGMVDSDSNCTDRRRSLSTKGLNPRRCGRRTTGLNEAPLDNEKSQTMSYDSRKSKEATKSAKITQLRRIDFNLFLIFEAIVVRAGHPLTHGKVTKERLFEFPHAVVELTGTEENERNGSLCRGSNPWEAAKRKSLIFRSLRDTTF